MSQKNDILTHLKRKKSITPIEALNKFGCFRLGARIHDLRELGYKIETTRFEADNGSRPARYVYMGVGA